MANIDIIKLSTKSIGQKSNEVVQKMFQSECVSINELQKQPQPLQAQ